MDVEKIIRERKEEARCMRRTVAEWVIRGMSKRQARKEYAKIRDFELKTEFLEDLMTEDGERTVYKI